MAGAVKRARHEGPMAIGPASGLATDLAGRLRKAIDATLNADKVRTGDLGGTASTAAFTKALVSRIGGG